MDKLTEFLIKPFLIDMVTPQDHSVPNTLDSTNHLEEKESKIKNIIAIFPGRFQPPSLHHKKVYDWLVENFGKDKVYIATSDKVEMVKSPLSFSDKKLIWSKHGVPSDKIVQVKNPYKSEEITSKFDKNSTAVVFIFGEKDADRINSGIKKSGEQSYFLPYNGNENNLESYAIHGYFVKAPHISIKIDGRELSGTLVRELLGSKKMSKELKINVFKKIFGWYDEYIYSLIVPKFEVVTNETTIPVLQESNSKTSNEICMIRNLIENHADIVLKKVLREIGDEDLGIFLNKNKDVLKTISSIAINDKPDFYELEEMPGEEDTVRAWQAHTTDVANRIGYKVVDFIGGEEPKEDVSITKVCIVKEDIKKKSKELLLCGGAAGHMIHPFEDMDLTFGDLKKIISSAMQGELGTVTEKLDGQNIMVSWKNGKLIAARNKGHLKNYGENALDVDALKRMFSGRGDLTIAFSQAVEDLQSAISKLTQEQKNKIFNEGKRFMSVEILFPKTQNVIPYGLNLLVFHGTVELDIEGNIVSRGDEDSARMLSGMIQQIDAHVQNTFTIRGPKTLDLMKPKDSIKKKNYFFSKLKELQSQFSLKDSDTIMLYHQRWWEKFVTEKSKEFKCDLSPDILQLLIRRWAFMDKSFSISNMKREIKCPEFLSWILEFDKKNHTGQWKKNIEPFETLFLLVGTEVLQNTEGFLSQSPEKSSDEIKRSLKKTIEDLKSKDLPENKIKKLEIEMERLKRLGGTSNIVPSEGLVFSYTGSDGKQRLIKLTGPFVVINQILGLMRYS